MLCTPLCIPIRFGTSHLYSCSSSALVSISLQLIVEINSQVALFRDMLIHVGQARDCPELREKIRKLRRTCVEACKHTGQIIMPQVKRWVLLKIINGRGGVNRLFCVKSGRRKLTMEVVGENNYLKWKLLDFNK